jgi:hypothetical protein
MLLHPHQKEIVSSPARFKVIRAGRRSGKSTLEIEDMVFTAVSKADSPVFYIAPTQTQARAIIWEALKSRLAKIGDANEARLEMKVPTVDGGTSVISIGGWENRENFRGRKAKKIYFDEVDTMKDFFIGWQEIFRPALTDLEGAAMFCGTPKKENPNLRRLEKMAEHDTDYQAFHFKTRDNPHISESEIGKAHTELDNNTFVQEYLAEYVENVGSLFKYDALIDVFSNTVDKQPNRYLIADIAEDGTDKTKFSFWEGLEEYRRESFERLNTEQIIEKIREYSQQDRIPFSNIAVDAIGVGAAVASSSMLDGIIGYKSSYAPLKTDIDPIRTATLGYLPGAPILTSDYKNLRSQCVFVLAELVNNHKIASKVTGRPKENIIEELATYQDASKGDGKRFATPKEDVKELIGRSPDDSDTWLMRMYFYLRERITPGQDVTDNTVHEMLQKQFNRNKAMDRSTR